MAYVNDQFMSYELPSTIPLLHKDTNNIKILTELKTMEFRQQEFDIIFINLLKKMFS